jgi:hypothetical protein
MGLLFNALTKCTSKESQNRQTTQAVSLFHFHELLYIPITDTSSKENVKCILNAGTKLELKGF